MVIPFKFWSQVTYGKKKFQESVVILKMKTCYVVADGNFYKCMCQIYASVQNVYQGLKSDTCLFAIPNYALRNAGIYKV